jgi:hypothetical protein
MNKYKLSLTLVAVLAATLLISTALADAGLVRTTWPSGEDPGLPYYVRTEPMPPHIYDDGEWAVFVFYRDPGCVPADFNLLSFFDIPAAFGCSLTVHGSHLWQGAPFSAPPKIVTVTGDGAVPVWFAPAAAVESATQDGALTIGELAGLDGLLVGYAAQFNETLHPHPLPPELGGGGGHPNPKLILDANGQLNDGRQFHLHITRVQETTQSILIQFE